MGRENVYKLPYQDDLEFSRQLSGAYREAEQKANKVDEFMESPSASEIWRAGFEANNSAVSSWAQTKIPLVPAVEGYSPFDKREDGTTDIAGYEQWYSAFVDSQNPETTAAIKANIDRENRNRKTLYEGGWQGVAAAMAAGVVDPINLALLAFPLSTEVGVARMTGASMATGLVATGGSEAALQATQETRTAEESALNIIAGSLIDGTLGAAVGAFKSAERQVLVDQVSAQLRHASAAQRVSPGIATAEDVVNGPLSYLARLMSKVTPLGRSLQSDSPTVRAITQEMVESGFHLKGDLSPTAVESLVKLDYARFATIEAKVRRIEKAFIKDTKSDRDTFSIELINAMRNGDQHANPHIQQAAALLRGHIDELWGRAAEAKIPGTFMEVRAEDGSVTIEPIKTTTADSYMTRRYDLAAIRSDPEGFKQAWIDGLKDQRQRVNAELKAEYDEALAQPLDFDKIVDDLNVPSSDIAGIQQAARELAGTRKSMDALVDGVPMKVVHIKTDDGVQMLLGVANGKVVRTEASKISPDIKQPDYLPDLDDANWYQIASDIQDRITNLRVGDTHFSIASGQNVTKKRVDVKDSFLDAYLVKDWQSLMDGYTRSLVPKIRMAERFGEGEGGYMLKDQLEGLRQEFSSRISQLDQKISSEADAKVKKALVKQKESLISDMTNRVRDLEIMRDRILHVMQEPSYLNPENRGVLSALRTARSWNVVTMLSNVALSSVPDIGRLITYHGGGKFMRAFARSVFTKNIRRSNMPADDLARLASAMERTSTYRLQTISEVEDGVVFTPLDRHAHWVADKTMTLSGMKHWNSTMKTIAGYLVGDRIGSILTKGTDRAILKRMGMTDDMIDRAVAQARQHSFDDDGLINLNLDQWTDRQLVETIEAAAIKETDMLVVTPGVGDKPILMTTEIGRTLGQFKSFIIASTNRMMVPLTQEKGARPWIEIMTQLGLGAGVYTIKEKLAGREPSDDPNVIAAKAVENTGLAGYFMEFYNAGKAMGYYGDGESQGRFYNTTPWSALLGPSAQYPEAAYKLLNRDTSAEQKAKAVRKLMPMQNHYILRRGYDELESGIADVMGGSGGNITF